MPKNVQASFEKYQRNAGAAAEAMKAGVAGVTESPTAKAADNTEKMLRNFQDSITSGRYANNARAVTADEWKTAMVTKGVPNMANGVRNLSPRAKRNITAQLEKANQVAAQIASMPNQTEADAEARALTAIRLMRATKKGS